jgi:hypothetical protein
VIKNKITSLFGPLLAAVALLPLLSGVAWAANAASANSSSTGSANGGVSGTSTVEQRIVQRKSAIKPQLTDLQTQILASKCVSAQATLKNIKTKDLALADNRKLIYTDLSAKISVMIGKMQKQGIDVVALKNAQAQFNDIANKYLIDSDSYKTTLDDLTAMGCVKDPAGFEATLVSARQLRTQLANDSSLIKKALANVAQALADSKTALAKSAVSNKGVAP